MSWNAVAYIMNKYRDEILAELEPPAILDHSNIRGYCYQENSIQSLGMSIAPKKRHSARCLAVNIESGESFTFRMQDAEGHGFSTWSVRANTRDGKVFKHRGYRIRRTTE